MAMAQSLHLDPNPANAMTLAKLDEQNDASQVRGQPFSRPLEPPARARPASPAPARAFDWTIAEIPYASAGARVWPRFPSFPSRAAPER